MESTSVQAIAATVDGLGAEAADAGGVIEVGHGGSLTSDLAAFGDALAAAGGASSVDGVSPVIEAMMGPLGAIDRGAEALGAEASAMMASGEALSPAEIVELTMRSQEFMFHSQLTANVANRTADGVQQLFRQQG